MKVQGITPPRFQGFTDLGCQTLVAQAYFGKGFQVEILTSNGTRGTYGPDTTDGRSHGWENSASGICYR